MILSCVVYKTISVHQNAKLLTFKQKKIETYSKRLLPNKKIKKKLQFTFISLLH